MQLRRLVVVLAVFGSFCVGTLFNAGGTGAAGPTANQRVKSLERRAAVLEELASDVGFRLSDVEGRVEDVQDQVDNACYSLDDIASELDVGGLGFGC
jgi:hypothetical protein